MYDILETDSIYSWTKSHRTDLNDYLDDLVYKFRNSYCTVLFQNSIDHLYRDFNLLGNTKSHIVDTCGINAQLIL